MKLKVTKTEPIQYQIADYVVRNLTASLQELAESPVEQICYTIFKNFRITNNVPHGLRLSSLGHKFLSRHFSTKEFTLEEPLHGIVLINLDKAMTRPYYLTKNKVAFYDDNDAAWFRLGGNDLKYFSGNL